jgi:hypothetical protein
MQFYGKEKFHSALNRNTISSEMKEKVMREIIGLDTMLELHR